MKAIVVILLAIGAMVFAGWITVGNDGDAATATFNKTEAKEDTAEVIEKGKELADKAGSVIEDAGNRVEGAVDELQSEPAEEEPVETSPSS